MNKENKQLASSPMALQRNIGFKKVSFQRHNRLTQKLILRSFHIFQKYFFFKEVYQPQTDLDFGSSFSEFMQSQQCLISRSEVKHFTDLLNKNRILEKFIRELFAYSCPILVPELILVCWQIVTFYHTSNLSGLPYSKLKRLIHNEGFLQKIYSHGSLDYLNLARLQEVNSEDRQQLSQMGRVLVLTVLQMIENVSDADIAPKLQLNQRRYRIHARTNRQRGNSV